MLRILSMVIILLIVISSNSYAYISKRHSLPDSTKTNRALFLISSSDEASSILKDYRQYLLAVKLYHLKENRNSNFVLNRFIKEYPHSYLYRDVLWLKILNYLDLYSRGRLSSEESVLLNITIDEYLNRYPNDEDILFIKSRFIDILSADYTNTVKKLYLIGDQYFDYLDNLGLIEKLSHEDAVTLAKALIKRVQYDDAVNFINRAIKRWDTNELHGLLADTYFRMKNYISSALEYEKAGDLYRAAIAYKRADMIDDFERLYSIVTKGKTKESCELIISKAEELRWHADYNGALKILRSAYRGKYPCKEELLWAITWTEYRMGNFLSASYNLKNLYKRYKKDRYLYWLIRSLKQMGKNTDSLYKKLKRDSFYSYLLNKRVFHMKVSYTNTLNSSIMEDNNLLSKEVKDIIERADFLYKVGLGDFAVDDLRASYVRYKDRRMPICRFIREKGEFYEAMKCVVGIHSEDSLTIRYPLAYWDIIDNIAEENGLDPLLLLSIMREESRFNEDALSVSGALGLMQLMPFTAQWIANITGIKEELSTNDIIKPENNIFLSAHYLKRLLEEFNSVALAVAAYNAGEGSVRRWIKEQGYESLDEFIEDIPYSQTYYYVQKVLSSYINYIKIYRKGTY